MSDDPIRRAERAKVELRETDAAFQAMRDKAMATFFASKPADHAVREEIYRVIVTISTIQEYLKGVAAGDAIAKYLEEMKTPEESSTGA